MALYCSRSHDHTWKMLSLTQGQRKKVTISASGMADSEPLDSACVNRCFRVRLSARPALNVVNVRNVL